MMWLIDAPTAPNPSMPGREPVPPGMMLAQYELIRELARGGMGAVYLARDTRTGGCRRSLANPDDGVLAELPFPRVAVQAYTS
jgi:serine/threonine protein kinase